jgi:hypothetical protein
VLQVTHRVALSHHSPPAVGIRYQASAVRVLLHTAVAEQPQNNRESCRRKPVGLHWTHTTTRVFLTRALHSCRTSKTCQRRASLKGNAALKATSAVAAAEHPAVGPAVAWW